MRPTRTKIPARTPLGIGGIRTPARTPHRGPGSRPRMGGLESHKDPVEVYCRVRPSDEEAESCIKIFSDTLIQLTPPLSSRAYTSGKETQYSFKGNLILFVNLVSMASCFFLNISTLFAF